jgi:hypothetical protein
MFFPQGGKMARKEQAFHLHAVFPYPELEKIVSKYAENLKREGESIYVTKANASCDPATRVEHGEHLFLKIAEEWSDSDPEKTMKTEKWAAKQYFTLLLIDWCRFGFFRDHGMCDPPPKD